jgi:uncharacterized membrane protein YeaQ/YmgE (transglycosylase-associated protein family)
MLIIGILVLGIASGWAAQLILGQRRDWTEAAAAGIIGSFVGGLLSSLIFGDGLALRPSGLIGSILRAVILLALRRRWRART